MMDYNYPLDYTWSTKDIIDVMSLYNAVEQAYEGGEFQDVSGYSIYKVFKASQENDWIKL